MSKKQPPLFGYVMNSLRDTLTNEEEREKVIAEFKKEHGDVQGEEFGRKVCQVLHATCV